MQSIHEKLCSINIKRQEINPEVLRGVYKFAAEHKPRRPFFSYIRRFAWAGAAVVAIAAAIVVLSLPQTKKDLTFANIGYYTIDINPSISVQTDGSKNVMSAEGLNEDGKKLLDTVNCDGRPINEALQIILDAAREMGYLDGKNVVIGYFGSGGSGVSMETVSELAGSGKAVLLTGTKKQYEDFIAGGLQPGLELLELEGAKLGLEEDSPYSDIIAALIESSLPATEKPSATPLPSSSPTQQPSKEPAPEPTAKPTADSTPDKTPTAEPTKKPAATKTPSPSPAPTTEEDYLPSSISGSVTDSGIRLNWSKITSGAFSGYKVVASKTNPNPKYPDDGYLYYYTDSSTTTTLVPFSKLQPDTNYYFSITVLYDGGRAAGNSVMLKTPKQETVYQSTTLSGGQTETGISLSWTQVTAAGAQGYKVVASATDSTPSYPANGYIEWITNLSSTSRSYCSDCTLQAGQSYWFAITVVYSDGTKLTSNVVQLTMPAPVTPSPSPSASPDPTPETSPDPTPDPTPSESPSASPTESGGE